MKTPKTLKIELELDAYYLAMLYRGNAIPKGHLRLVLSDLINTKGKWDSGAVISKKCFAETVKKLISDEGCSPP